MQNDFWMFFRSWLAAPLRVAAVAPSGSALARIMTQDITSSTGPVIELGLAPASSRQNCLSEACGRKT